MGRFLLVSLSLLVVIFSLNGIGADHHCPLDWLSFEKSCYKFIRQRKSWNEAERSCVQLQRNSHLASILSPAESFFISNVISRKLVPFTGVWIGLNDPKKNRTWKWTDGSNFGYTSWARKEPSSPVGGKFCVQLTTLSRYFRWKAVNCKSKNFFICKM
uniref:C-type lectin domain-containing protein n=1 Tax=Laticauda laticaudata TaxID=8630 RepID=A0A8C5RJ98_LATLA